MAQYFWVILVACVFLVAVCSFLNIGVFVLSYRANLHPSRAMLVRGVLGLFVLFVLPRIQPYLLLSLGALFALVIWELTARVLGAGKFGERPNPIRAPIDN